MYAERSRKKGRETESERKRNIEKGEIGRERKVETDQSWQLAVFISVVWEFPGSIGTDKILIAYSGTAPIGIDRQRRLGGR